MDRRRLLAEDPFLLEGLVKSFVIREWNDTLLPDSERAAFLKLFQAAGYTNCSFKKTAGNR